MIRWTTREWRQIAEVLVAREVDPDHHGWRGELLAAMQQVLPKDRWRAPHSLNEAKKVLKPMMAVETRRPIGHVLPPKPVALGPETLSTEALLVELARRVARLLEPHAVDRGFHPKHNPVAQGADVPKRPRVLVLGPMNGQRDVLRTQHPGLDLRFVASEDRVGLVDEVGPSCVGIVVWTNFISHQHFEHAKHVGLVTPVTGGLHAISTVLSQFEEA